MNDPAKRNAEQLILEGIVTTVGEDGEVNVAPMGPVVDRNMDGLRLRPFNSSRTYQNLARSRRGIFHVTDDSLLLATAALGRPDPAPELRKLERFDGYVISDACRWYAFEVVSLDTTQERAEIECCVVDRGELRPFLGWNRAMHCVLEAAILATRVGMLPKEEVQRKTSEFKRIIEKTASDRERAAFRYIERYVAQQ